MTKFKPYIKWAGGKTQLLEEINKRIPSIEIDTYIEPFVGGGSVFISLMQNYNFKDIYINDINECLMRTYVTIKYKPNMLCDKLRQYETEYLQCSSFEYKKKYYNDLRNKFNAIKIDTCNIGKFEDSDECAINSIDIGALFIFLNKTCFNGLYKENKKGIFNVAIGGDKQVQFIDYDNILGLSKLFQKVRMSCMGYDELLDSINITDKTFVYLDPPYKPILNNINFNNYNKSGFNDKSQIELKNKCDYIANNNGHFLLSNSDTLDGFFDNLYKDYCIDRVLAKRMVNCKGNGRGKINELMIFH